MNKYLKKRMILILSVFILAFVVTGTASAADTEDSIGNVNTATITASENIHVSSGESEILSDESAGAFTDLNDLIENASENSTVTLNKNYSFDDEKDSNFTNGINITKAITIEGNGFTLDGKNSARIFYILSANVTLNNIIFINGNAEDGNGGAIYWSSSALNGTVTNSIFENNSAYAGSAIYWGCGFGTILNSTFRKNTGVTTDPIFENYAVNQEQNTFSDNVITDEFAKWCYDKLASGNTIELEQDWIVNNPFMITTSNITIDGKGHKITTNNTAFMAYRENINITNINFIDCYNKSAIIATRAIIDDEYSIKQPTIRITNCNFTNCFNNNSIGAVRITGAPDSEIAYCNFINCESNGNGAAISSWTSDSSHYHHCNFTNCKGSSGGALMVHGHNCTVSDCIFDNCTASGSGGAICSRDGVYFEVYNSTFKNCSASSSGGAIVLLAPNGGYNSGYATIDECNFEECSSSNGGAVYSASTQPTISNSNFTACGSAENGGAIFNSGNNGLFVNLQIDNSSAIIGSGIYSTGYNCTVKNTNLTSNTGETDALYSTTEITKENVIEKDTELLNNNTLRTWIMNKLNGGNTLIEFDRNWNMTEDITINVNNLRIIGDNFTIDGNNSTFRFIIQGKNNTIENLTFKNFTSVLSWTGSDGVVNYCTFDNNNFIGQWSGNNCTIANSTFTGNKAIPNSKTGTPISWTGSYGSILDSYFYDNYQHDSNHRGVIYWTGSYGTIGRTTFINCSSRLAGGSVTWTGANGIVYDCIFVNATTNRYAGCIFWNGNNGTLKNSTFINCTVINGVKTSYGHSGTVYWTGADGTLINSTFIDNYGRNDAGALAWNGDNGIIKHNAFINSTSQEDNGILLMKNDTDFDDNWYGVNDPDLIAIQGKNSSSYLTVKSEQVYDNLVCGELNGIVKIYFVKNGTDEFVDYNRPIEYTVNEGDVTVVNPVTEQMKIYTDIPSQKVNMSFKVDNVDFGDYIFGSTANTGFTELKNLIDGSYDGETLLLNNNYTYNPEDDEELVNGVVIDKPVILAFNASSISGNKSAKNIFNINCNDVILENITIKDVNGDAITAVGDNIQINNLTVENINGYAINITCDNATIHNIDSSITDEDIIVNGALSIDVSADDVVYPDTATVTVNAGVDGTYIALVNDKEYNVTVKNGTGSTVLEVLPADTYDVIVNGQFGEESPVSTANTNFTVIEINIPEIVENKTTELQINLPSDATGEISLLVDGEIVDTKEVVNGSAVLEIPPLDAGQHNITVSYPGNDEHNALNKTFDATVKVDTNANITIPEIIENKTTEIPIDLPEDATGNVSVIVDGEIVDSQELVNGSAVLEIPSLDAGHHNISVIYPGDDKYASINQTSDVPVKVEGEFNITEPKVYENQTTEIPIDLPSDATGNVSVMVDGELMDSQELVNGSAVLEIPALSKENHTISVTYTGDDKYASQSEEFNVSVLDDVIITANDLVKYYSAPDKFEINLTDSKGNPLTNKSVNITVNGVSYSRTTNENGSASLNIRLNPGEYEVVVSADNVTLNKNITVLSTINGTDIVKIFRNGTQYYVTIKGADGSYLPEDSKDEFNINGVLYNRTVKGDEGLVKLNINLDEGEYIVTATNLETNESVSNTITVLSRIASEDITKYFKNDTQYEVTLFDENGTPVGAGVSVTFNVNGIFYTRYTNDEGVAKLNINLPPGDWIVTADYNGCLVSNNIKVLPVLTADNLVKQQGADAPFVATLLNGQGQPYENQKVTFNINGVFDESTTDSNGQAKLTVNLPNGEYIITSSYNGCSISNNLTITN